MTAITTLIDRPAAAVSGAELCVPLIDGRTSGYVNFDYAASAPALAAVTDHLAALLPHYASVHRGAGYASQVSTASYEQSRRVIGEFLSARADDAVVFTRNTTDALNLLAHCTPGEVVHLDIEHHANFLPWQQCGARVVAATPTIAGTLEAIEAELACAPAALLAVTGASNVTGEVLPIAELAAIAHRHGARILVDAAQLAPHRRIDIEALGIDYLALSGHKLYAPFGAGVLIGRADWLDAAEPYLAGGGAVREVSVFETEWATGPARHEAGTPNVLGVAAIAAACTAIATLDEDTVARHEESLTRLLRSGLADLDGVDVLRIWAEDSDDTVGIVAFTVEGFEPGEVAAYLSAEHGIGVRDGRFCAHPLLAKLGHGAGAVRASIGLGSTAADVNRLILAIEALRTCGPAWGYAKTEGHWAPSPETRPLPDFLGLGQLGDLATPGCGSFAA
ncbi:aminotransferase class V-fold PLP-dependent enzyme [Tomitella biformata]|uniref:aminotransferase class V-fold PLP-dependent enzyme n=1 Tax=Tomitella biformata TaxID=630403 RepID=UPI0004660AD2|nr:aminotransferase class V-fold PLP-dependent enzyme [Tomitella biformata]